MYMIREIALFSVAVLIFAGQARAVTDPEIVDHDSMLMDHGGGHMMDFDGGMVMGQNVDTLPMSCKGIEDEVEITVRAGRKYAEKFPGTMFGYDNHEWRVEPCSKITVHFTNEDNIRHQFMMHGLPKYIYKSGMFHLEVTGPGKISGTLIVPANDETYLVHCDIAQHMEKGMKGQLVVGSGGVSLPSIPGVTAYAFPDTYELGQTGAANTASDSASAVGSDAGKPSPLASSPDRGVANRAETSASSSLISGMLVIGLAFGLLGAPLLARKFEGMTKQEIYDYLVDRLVTLVNFSVQQLNRMVQFLSEQIRKVSAKS
ncbi:MAG: multicopper oxidase domain-containing protein [Methylococcaceae bacterium]|nr:multicopper oxidase domain-containing protein [Methylococcaceae bacterium]